jgi:hypothetical protein
MKPTLSINKFLLAGMLASCVFIVNCAGGNNDSKNSQAKILEAIESNLSLPKCSDDTMELLTQRSTLFTSIRELLPTDLDGSKLNSDQKEKLQTFISEISQKSKSIMANVRSAKVNGLPAAACTYKYTEKDGTEKQLTYELPVIKKEDLSLAKKVSKVNEKANVITDGERDVWNAQDTLLISPKLAQFLSDDRLVNGKRMITNGNVVAGGQDFLILKRNTSASLCFSTTVDGQEIDESGAQATLGVLSEPRLDNLNRINIDLTLFITASYGGNRVFSLTCILPDSSDLNDALVDTFGNLLKKKPAGTAAPKASEPNNDQKLTKLPDTAQPPAAAATPAPEVPKVSQ